MAKQRKKAENPGEYLQQHRWKEGISIDNSAYALRVETKQLEALEEWRLDDLPKGIYFDGLLKKYAKILKIPMKTLHSNFPEYVEGNEEIEPAAINHTTKVAGRTIIFSRVVLLSLVLAIVAVVIGYVVWQSSGLNSKPSVELFNVPEQTQQESFVLKGDASEGAQVFVNGTAVLVEPTGEFEALVVLREGSNTLEVRALNNLSQETIQEEIIIYKP